MDDLRRAWGLLSPYRFRMLGVFGLLFVTNVAALSFPWILKIVIDSVIPAKDTKLLGLCVMALLIAFVLRFVGGYFYELWVAKTGEDIIADLRISLFKTFHRLSLSYIKKQSIGALVARLLSDSDNVRDFLFDGLVDFIYSILMVFCISAVLLYLDPIMAVLVIGFVSIAFFIYLKHTPKLKEENDNLRVQYENLSANLTDSLNGMRVSAAHGCQDKELKQFSLMQNDLIDSYMSTHKLGFFMLMGSEFISGLATVLLIAIGVLRVFKGQLSAGGLVAFYSYLGLLLGPLVRMAVINNYFQQARASLDRIYELLDKKENVVSGEELLAESLGDIVLNNISFSYERDQEVLKNVSFTVKQNSICAIVGKSGEGKTTILDLLLRFYDASGGSITVNSKKLSDLDLESYRSKISLVAQDDYLFNASIANNIAYAAKDVSRKEIEGVAKAAHAHDFILNLKDGYDTIIGSGGLTLSVGQRQRISIARALLRNPQLLILDEATSNIDSLTERKIVNTAFKELMQGRTCLMIAHRLSSIVHADNIIVLNEGKIEAQGKHEDLLFRCALYRQLWEKQENITETN